MYLHDKLSFTETFSGNSPSDVVAHDDVVDMTVKSVDVVTGEHGMMLKLGFEDGVSATIAVTSTAPNLILAHDVLREAGAIAPEQFVGMKYIDVLEYEFPDADFSSEPDNNNAA